MRESALETNEIKRQRLVVVGDEARELPAADEVDEE